MRTRFLRAAALTVTWLVASASPGFAQGVAASPPGAVTLKQPSRTGGLPVMEALSARASVREWAPRPLAMQDLSDLLWAANGVNRPDGKRTAASAQNAQDVDLYVFDETGVYLYDAASHTLRTIAAGDHRAEIATPSSAPVQLMLISDLSRFRSGSPELRAEWGAIDTGIVAQNVALFCAGRGLVTRPRASFNRDALRVVLKLSDTQRAYLNMPVGYPVGTAK